MGDNSLKSKTKNGIMWSALERFSVQGIQFLVMLVMARLLMPRDYGIVGMLSIFLAVAQSLIDSGFSNALIRKQNRTEVDNSTVFFFNIAISIFIYLILFAFAPIISSFYDTPELTKATRVLCLLLICNSFSIVQKSILEQKMDFKTQAISSFIAVILSGIVGITMAYKGYSYWSLITQIISNSVFYTIIIWIASAWRPRFVFSITSFKELFSFGSKLLISGLIERIYKNIYPLIIGKAFSAELLGYYTRAHNFSDFPSSSFTGIIQRVSYPAMCSIQENDEQLRILARKFLRASAFIIFPVMFGMAVLARPLVVSLVGEQWSFSADLLQIICFQMVWYPVGSINANIMQVKGRSDYFLAAETIKKIMCIVIILIAIPFGIKALCIGSVIGAIVELIVNAYFTKKVLNYGLLLQIKDLYPILLLSLIMSVMVLLSTTFFSNYWMKLIVGFLIGCIIFYFGSRFLNIVVVVEIKKMIFKTK